MIRWQYIVISLCISYNLVNSAVIVSDDVDEQGLYSKSDHVVILTNKNFDKKIYGQKNAFIVQFYNSYCGHCRAFAPKFKALAKEIRAWSEVIKLAVLDCSVEENNEICRQFEVMAYPSLRYLHENYVKGNSNVGEKFQSAESAAKLKDQMIFKIQNEQQAGQLKHAPSLDIDSPANIQTMPTPSGVTYTFLIFESPNSTIGSEIVLDTSDYTNILIKRVSDSSKLAESIGVKTFPAVAVVGPSRTPNILNPGTPTKSNILKTINTYLRSQNFVFPKHLEFEDVDELNALKNKDLSSMSADAVFYSDLEKTLKTSLHTEITRHKVLDGEPLEALLDFLNVLITAFPFRANMEEYILELHNKLSSKSSWNGNEVYELVKKLEASHAPVFSTNADYIRCKGSQSKYRGYTCGLWTLFHVLTVNAARKPGYEAPHVLRAMHGYVKHFFGCTECSQHFQAMAARNRLFDVKENDKAVLWLWISHNEVNLRLAGDVTEDPAHPKIQYPSVTNCPDCRLSRGAWNLPAVFEYLQKIYGANNIHDARSIASAAASPGPFSNLDIGMLSLLYLLSFFLLILVIKFYITRHLVRKRRYKHAWGKV